MRLRTQLTLFFMLMMASILGVGLLAAWGGIRIAEGFTTSLTEVERLSHIRALQNLVVRERSALALYQGAGGPSDVERLRALHRLSSLRIREMDLFAWDDEVLVAFLTDHHKRVGDFLNGANLPAATKMSGVFASLDAELARLNEIEHQVSSRVREGQRRLRSSARSLSQVMFVFIFWQVLLGFLFAAGTFRAVHRSLLALQKGTAAFGAGRFDHRIPVTSADELGELAGSFNEMAENIKNLEVKTVHMHRMSAVGQLAGGVAHEINNPLTGVLGQAQLLMEKIPTDDPRRAHAEKIERAANRCRRIVRSLLDFSRQKETRFVPYALHEALDGTLELCEPDFQGKDIRVVKTLAAVVPTMTGNVSQLQQVFLNIVSNAVHALPQGGTIFVSTALVKTTITPGESPVDAVEVVFKDTGSGIAPEHLSHVFEPFFTTKEIGKGTGLGLSVSLGIIRNHGGDIRVESGGKGEGTTFRVLLPVAPSAGRPVSLDTLPEDFPSGARFNT